MDLKDVSSNGTGDLVGITVYRNKGGVWYSNNWTTAGKTEMKVICGGALSVSGSNVSTTSLARLKVDSTNKI